MDTLNISNTGVSNECGYLELISGPMYSGKTSRLLNLYKQFKFCGIEILTLNHSDDSTRYSATHLSSHDLCKVPCIMTDTLNSIINLTSDEGTNNQISEEEFKNIRVILINEIQFFKEEALDWIKCAVEKHNKHVYVCGLDGDFQRNKFGTWMEFLLPLCDNHIKLHSYCSHCKVKKAIFTHRITGETAQKIIGVDCYVPLCRRCYIKVN